MSAVQGGATSVTFRDRKVWPYVLIVLFTSAVAGVAAWNSGGGITCGADRVLRGANVSHGLLVAGLGGIAAAAALGLLRRWRLLSAAVLLLAAVNLAVAVGFVADDSATRVQYESCVSLGGGATPDTLQHYHLYILYPLWGIPLVLLGSAGLIRATSTD